MPVSCEPSRCINRLKIEVIEVKMVKTAKITAYLGQVEPCEIGLIPEKYWKTNVSVESLMEEFSMNAQEVYKKSGAAFLLNVRCKICANLMTAPNRTDAMSMISKAINKRRPVCCDPCRRDGMLAKGSITPFKTKANFAPKNNQTNKQEFYDSWEWTTIRYSTLLKYGKSCMVCGCQPGDERTGGGVVKLCVDHIKPISKHWDLRLDENNLQVLCMECNKGKGAWDETDHRPQ